MRSTNQKTNFGMFGMLMTMFSYKGNDNAGEKATHVTAYGYGSPEFIPKKHTIQSYGAQRRAAQQRRRTKTGCNKS